MIDAMNMLTTLAQQPVSYSGSGLIIWIACLAPPMLLGLYAQWKVHSSFNHAKQVRASSGMTGAEVAREIVRAHGVHGVEVEETHGFLSDHYDPSAKVLRLSPEVYHGNSVASAGIAAHEAGHALQHAQNYLPLKLRSAIVPMAKIGGTVANVVIIAGMFGMFLIAPQLGRTMLIIGILGLSCVAVFQLITLPVEFDASRRAKDLLTSTGIVAPGEETREMSRVLNAAALTYIAALVSTLSTILYYVLILFTSRRD